MSGAPFDDPRTRQKPTLGFPKLFRRGSRPRHLPRPQSCCLLELPAYRGTGSQPRPISSGGNRSPKPCEKGTRPSPRLQVRAMGQGEQPAPGGPSPGGGRPSPQGAQSRQRKGSGKPFLPSSSRKFIFHVLLLLCPRSSFSWWCVGVCEGFILSPLNHCSTTSFQPFCTAEKSLVAFLLIFLLKEAAGKPHGRAPPAQGWEAARPLLAPAEARPGQQTPPHAPAGTPKPRPSLPAASVEVLGTLPLLQPENGSAQKGRSRAGCPERGALSPPPREPGSKPKCGNQPLCFN